MKVFKREFWGTVLIWLGAALLLVLLYESIREYFPRSSQKDLRSLITAIFSKSRTPEQPPPPKPPPEKIPVRPEEEYTSNMHQTQGQYDIWVWRVKPAARTGNTVQVSIMHAVGGETGGFHIVAYADTTGDGKPDKEIARSGFFTSSNPGEWSSFEFTTDEGSIFVGNAWPAGSNVSIYRGNGPWPRENFPLEDRFYHKISDRWSDPTGPAYTNLRFGFSNKQTR